jgi:hypothetical protein
MSAQSNCAATMRPPAHCHARGRRGDNRGKHGRARLRHRHRTSVRLHRGRRHRQGGRARGGERDHRPLRQGGRDLRGGHTKRPGEVGAGPEFSPRRQCGAWLFGHLRRAGIAGQPLRHAAGRLLRGAHHAAGPPLRAILADLHRRAALGPRRRHQRKRCEQLWRHAHGRNRPGADRGSPVRRAQRALRFRRLALAGRLAAKVGVSAALSTRINSALFLGGEVRYLRAYGSLGLDGFSGQALFAGPTLYLKLSQRMALSAAWNAQLTGRGATGSSLDLTRFERQQAKLRINFNF